jgi:hypothetical protein
MVLVDDDDVIVVDTEEAENTMPPHISTHRSYFVPHVLEKPACRSPVDPISTPIKFMGKSCYNIDYVPQPHEKISSEQRPGDRKTEPMGETGISSYRSHYIEYELQPRRPSSRSYRPPHVPFTGASRYATDFVPLGCKPSASAKRPEKTNLVTEPFQGESTYAKDYRERPAPPVNYGDSVGRRSKTEPLNFNANSEYRREYLSMPLSRKRIHLEPAISRRGGASTPREGPPLSARVRGAQTSR